MNDKKRLHYGLLSKLENGFVRDLAEEERKYLIKKLKTVATKKKEWLETGFSENIETFQEAAEKAAEDIINKPLHYHKGGIDVLAFAKMKLPPDQYKGFCRINVLKYVTRYDLKNGVEDLKKARFYLNELIELEEGGQNGRVDTD